LALSGKLVRSDFAVSLDEIGASCELNGLYLAQHKQHIDHHTYINHLKPHGTSKEFYRGIIADQARAIFNGKVFVEKDAQQTDAKQENHNLLLSANAEIDTKPQLEIYANEVKCAHGATVGQLDEEALFYLQSRGITKAAARNLLINAFAVSVFDKIKNEVMREHLQKLLKKYLPNNS
jgi:Fe-S cluster assembly protein SufD